MRMASAGNSLAMRIRSKTPSPPWLSAPKGKNQAPRPYWLPVVAKHTRLRGVSSQIETSCPYPRNLRAAQPVPKKPNGETAPCRVDNAVTLAGATCHTALCFQMGTSFLSGSYHYSDTDNQEAYPSSHHHDCPLRASPGTLAHSASFRSNKEKLRGESGAVDLSPRTPAGTACLKAEL